MLRLMCKSVVVVLFLVGLASASIYTVNPIVSGSVIDGHTGFDSTGYAIVGYWGGSYYESWQKFDIPVFPNEEIVSATFDTPAVIGQTGAAPAGVLLYRAENDSWTSSTIASGAPRIAATQLVHTDIFGSLAAANAAHSTDVTDYLTAAGEGQGQLLSIVMENWWSGVRGVASTPPTLTIVTQAVPEPATLAILGLGGLFFARRGKK